MALRRLSAALACAVVLAACGSGSAPSGSGSAPSASSTTPAAAPRTTVTRTVTAPAGSSPTRGSSPASASPTSPTVASTSSLASPSTPAAGLPMCVASDLALTSLGGSGATGHLLLAFGLRDRSRSSCRTGGYPGVLFLDAAGRGLPTTPDHTTRDFFGDTSLRELTLAPGGLVSFRLGVTDVAAGGSGSGCVAARGLQVIAPNDTATLRISREIFECGGTVSVSPLQAGTAALH